MLKDQSYTTNKSVAAPCGHGLNTFASIFYHHNGQKKIWADRIWRLQVYGVSPICVEMRLVFSLVHPQKSDTSDKTEERVDLVCVCSGLHSEPVYVNWHMSPNLYHGVDHQDRDQSGSLHNPQVLIEGNINMTHIE